MEEIPEVDEQLASSLWREVREKAEDKVEDKQSGRVSPPFPFMDTCHPLKDQWATDSLNQYTAICSLYREPRDKDMDVRQPSRKPGT